MLDGQLSTLLPRLLLERSKNSRLSKTLLYTVQIHANGALAAGLGDGLPLLQYQHLGLGGDEHLLHRLGEHQLLNGGAS